MSKTRSRKNLLLSDGGTSEGTSRGSLLLLGELLLGTVENLEERLNTDSHAGVKVRLRALDVIHEVVTEEDGHIDGTSASLLLEVTVEEDLGDETIGLTNVANRGDFSRRGGLGEVDGGSSRDGLLELLLECRSQKSRFSPRQVFDSDFKRKFGSMQNHETIGRM